MAYELWMGWIPNESTYKYGTIQSLSNNGDRGRAYGSFQFDYRYGLVPFLQYCVSHYPQFSGFSAYTGYSPGNTDLISNAGIKALFVEYANNYTADFLAAQNACAISQYLQPAIHYIANNYGYDITQKGAIVLGSLFSMAIRSGTVTAAQKYAGMGGYSSGQIIETTYNTYGSQDAGRWQSGTGISQRDKAYDAMTSGADIYSINADGTPGGGGGSALIEKVIELEMSRLGKNSYSQDMTLREQVFREPTGYSDCSSLQWKCFEQGADIFIGTYTDAQAQKGRRIWTNTTGSHVFTRDLQNQSGARRGDLIFWGKDNTDMTHVELYLGNNQCIGHGSGWGPTIKTLSEYNHPNVLRHVHRYIEGGGPGPIPTALTLLRWVPG